MQASTGAIIFYFFTLSTTITIHHQPGKCVGVKVKWWPWHFVSLCALWHFVAAQLKLLTHAPAQPSPLHRTFQRPPLKSSPTAEIAFEATQTFTILLLKSNIPSFSSSDRDEHGAEHFKRGVGWLVGWWDTQGRVIHQQSEFSRYAPSPSTSVSTFTLCTMCVQPRVEYVSRDRQMHIWRVRNEFSRCCLPVGSGGPQKSRQSWLQGQIGLGFGQIPISCKENHFELVKTVRFCAFLLSMDCLLLNLKAVAGQNWWLSFVQTLKTTRAWNCVEHESASNKCLVWIFWINKKTNQNLLWLVGQRARSYLLPRRWAGMVALKKEGKKEISVKISGVIGLLLPTSSFVSKGCKLCIWLVSVWKRMVFKAQSISVIFIDVDA